MNKKSRISFVVIFFFLSVIFFSAITERKEKQNINLFQTMIDSIGSEIKRASLSTHLPVFISVKEQEHLFTWMEKGMLWHTPLLKKILTERNYHLITQSNHQIDELLVLEGLDEENGKEIDLTQNIPGTGMIKVSPDFEKKLSMENEVATKEESPPSQKEQNHQRKREKKQEYVLDDSISQETIIKEFYAIDPSTEPINQNLTVEALTKEDMRVSKGGKEPKILLYHTHSQEGFADSVPGDPSTTIVGAGAYLADLLTNQYGYCVLHHEGIYDLPTRDYAYSNSLPQIEELLKQNPSIEVIIDLHRDATDAKKKLVTQIDGKDTALFMFFNGLSYTKKQGKIDYLKNPYIQENLALSFQMQVLCNEYYPGVTRKIYLKGYRYNMHLKPKTLLVEMGAQTNTREEIWNAIEILADVLDMEFSGVDR